MHSAQFCKSRQVRDLACLTLRFGGKHLCVFAPRLGIMIALEGMHSHAPHEGSQYDMHFSPINTCVSESDENPVIINKVGSNFQI